MGPACCDPLYRKAIRVSIGASLVVPYATSERPNVRTSEGQTRIRPEPAWTEDLMALKAAGFTLVALTPAPDARDLEEFLAGGTSRKIALLVGHEGGGLSPLAQGVADVRVRIGMVPGVDSLNVATATGIALYRIYESSE
jgi:tRNA G18 (ribose-2'-O)-methylase SpoU